jgi:hypothetical protein
LRFTRPQRKDVTRRRLRADARWIHRIGRTAHHVLVDPVFKVGGAVRGSEEALEVGFVFGEQKLGTAVGLQPPPSEIWMLKLNRAVHLAQDGTPGVFAPPRPPIPKQHGGKQVYLRSLGAVVHDRKAHQDVFRSVLLRTLPTRRSSGCPRIHSHPLTQLPSLPANTPSVSPKSVLKPRSAGTPLPLE